MLSINPSDVINAINTCKTEVIMICVALALAIVVSIAVFKLQKATKKLVRKEAWIAFLLVVVVAVNAVIIGPMNTMVALAMGSGSISEESITESEKLCTEIAEEGMVLLKNDANALPLANGTKLNVFGWSSTNPLYGGTGSGSMSAEYATVDILQSLKDAGFEVNQELVSFYQNYAQARPTVGMMGQDWTVREPSMDDYAAAGIFESAKSFSDTALVVIARSGGEGADLPTTLDGVETFTEGEGFFGTTGTRYSENKDDLDASKHYLELSNREIAMLDQVCADYANVVVLINAANTMELGFLDEYPSIKAAIWSAGPGQTGFTALGEILNGTVNPSGKTVDTFVKDLTKTPYYNNIGAFQYTNASQFLVEATMFSPETQPNFVNYVEGIYVGYKFYETAYAEQMEGFNYDEMVMYPFGYGLSYTTFDQKLVSVDDANGTITVTVEVTNTGAVAGKEIVQVYYNPPYTNGGIEKAAANLAGFAKTAVLEAGASETVTVTFTEEDMASFDYVNKGCYVLEAGDYEISINSDAHNKIAKDTVKIASDIVYDESNPRSTDEDAATTKMESAEGNIEYLSRADKFANYAKATAAPTNYEMTAEQLADFVNLSNYNDGVVQDETAEMPTMGANNGLTLADMTGLDYDDAKWESLLDQLTKEDMDSIVANGGYSTSPVASVGDPGTTDCDGPASINNNFTGKASIGFPAATMIAATWNRDLAKAFGQSIGKMADEMDVTGWYAPAMNIHRSAFAGRNFEYYSEDGLISGIMASSAIQGANEYGVYAYMKHFALNDQETNRTSMLCTWSNEQAIREIYLKPFELSVKEGNCGAVMSSFNYIGTRWAGAYAPLQQEVLRGEWGFDGFVLTDYFGGYGYMNATQGVNNGTDMMLAPMDIVINHPDMNTASDYQACREAAHHVLYTVANSRAVNNASTGLQNWQKMLITIDVIAGLLIVLLEVLAIKKYKKMKAVSPVSVEA